MLNILAWGAFTAAGVQFINRPKPVNKRLDECFRGTGLGVSKKGTPLYPRLHAKTELKNGHDFVYTVPHGMCLADFEKRRDEIEFVTGGNVAFEKAGGDILIKVRNDLPSLVEYHNQKAEGIIPITIGKTYDRFITLDLTMFPHLLIGGLTNSGKSNFLHQAIATILTNSPAYLFVMDFKRVEFAYLRHHPRVNRSRQIDEAYAVVKYLEKEMYRRQDILEEAECQNVIEYNIDNERLPYYVLVIDEFIEVSPELVKDEEQKGILKKLQDKITKIAGLARALGIHLIIGTQRPDAKILPGHLKTHFGGVVSFRMMNADNSRVVLGHGGAEKLDPTPGRAIFQYGPNETEIQVPYLSTREASGILYGTADGTSMGATEAVPDMFRLEQDKEATNR